MRCVSSLLMLPAMVALGIGSQDRQSPDKEGRPPQGAPVVGLVLSAPPRMTGSLGCVAELKVPLTTRNIGEVEKRVLIMAPQHTYRVLVYDASGNQVPLTEAFRRANDRSEMGYISTRGRKLPPGGACVHHIKLSDFVTLDRPGTYRAVILRRTLGWHQDVLSSNLIEFTVTE